MADDRTNRIAHRFFIEKLNSLEPFTKDDLMALTGWDRSSADTYWSKRYKNILEDIGGNRYRVRERFRLFQDWKKFKQLVTQVKAAPAKYKPTTFDTVVVYEFYMPLTHEAALKAILDSLFFKDVVLPRLKHRIGVQKLKAHFDYSLTDTDDSFLERVSTFIDSKFPPVRAADLGEQPRQALFPHGPTWRRRPRVGVANGELLCHDDVQSQMIPLRRVR